MIHIVVGPPCAGKSTFIDENAEPDTLRVDFDRIARTLGSAVPHDAPEQIRNAAWVAREAAIRSAFKHAEHDAWIIHGNPSPDDIATYRTVGAQFHVLDPGMDVCLQRAVDDERPERTAGNIRKWYANPPAVDEPSTRQGTPMTDLITRSFEVRAVEEAERTLEGVAVPWDSPADIGGAFLETFQRGAVQVPDDGRVLLYDRHAEPIGKLTSFEDTPEGWAIRAQFSDTAHGRDAWTLARDGVMTQLSVGFIPVEHREDAHGNITRTRVEVREVSVVPFGAYGTAAPITNVRSETSAADSTQERNTAMADTTLAAEVTELRGTIETLERSVTLLSTREPEKPVHDSRTAGEVLKAIVSGDESTIRSYEALFEERDFTGGTTADTVVKPGWVGDLTRIFDASSGVLADTFSTGTLPASGNTIEFAELSSNTIDVTAQAAEGDDITFGKVSITTRTAPVNTYAGGTELSRQSIERSTVGVLNTSLEALATAAGARKKAVLRAAYDALVAARVAAEGVVELGASLTAATADNWEDALIDAALKFETVNLPLERLIVSGTVFKKLRSLTVAGERVFRVAQDNASGSLNLPGLRGDFAGIPVLLDSGATEDSAVFVNGRAIRAYDSALVSLTDENIVNLSKAFAVYRYGAVAAEIPAGVVPVEFA
ncbi:MAG: HK97 family phage prohead protease [Microbacterium sp.]